MKKPELEHQYDNRLVLHHLSKDMMLSVMLIEDISKLCTSCFQFGINPLPGLRAYFPDFNWMMYSSEDVELDILMHKILVSNIVLDCGQECYVIGKSFLHQSPQFFCAPKGCPSNKSIQLSALKRVGIYLLPRDDHGVAQFINGHTD